MDDFIKFLSGFNFQTIISLIGIMWYFTRHIENKLDKVDQGLKDQGKRTDKLYEMFTEKFLEMERKMGDYRRDSDRKFYDILKKKR